MQFHTPSHSIPPLDSLLKRGACKRGLRKLGMGHHQLHSNYIPETWSNHDCHLTAMYLQPEDQGARTHDLSVASCQRMSSGRWDGGGGGRNGCSLGAQIWHLFVENVVCPWFWPKIGAPQKRPFLPPHPIPHLTPFDHA